MAELSGWVEPPVGLAAALRRRPEELAAFGLESGDVDRSIADRRDLAQDLLPTIATQADLAPLLAQPTTAALLWRVWLPWAIDLAQRQKRLNRPIVQAILGSQGTGKTTTAALLGHALAQLGVRSIALSIDDLYKTYADRQALRDREPRLIWRGPPGTHDVDLGIRALDRLRAGQTAEIPRFDKSLHGGQGDRQGFETVGPADVVLLEGWCVGLWPCDRSVFGAAGWAATLPELTNTDDRAFAQACNDRLADYVPLWQRCDRLAILKPADYRASLQWRQQAERDRRSATGSGLSDHEIEQFVLYFWRSLHPRLFIEPLAAGSGQPGPENTPHQPADLVVTFDSDRQLQSVY